MSAVAEVAVDPIEEARAKADDVASRLATLRERQETTLSGIAAIDARFGEIETTEHDVRLAAERGGFGERKRARLLTELAAERPALAMKRDALVKDAEAIATVLAEVEADDREARDRLAVLQVQERADAFNEDLDETLRLFNRFLAKVDALGETYPGLVRAHSALRPELRAQVPLPLAPPVADSYSFVGLCLELANPSPNLTVSLLPPIADRVEVIGDRIRRGWWPAELSTSDLPYFYRRG